MEPPKNQNFQNLIWHLNSTYFSDEKNSPCFNFRVKIDGFADTCFLHLLRLLALRFWKIGKDHSASMNEYLKDNLILGAWLENFFGWITLALNMLKYVQIN